LPEPVTPSRVWNDQAVVEALGQQADRLGLVAGRRKRLVQAPRAARELDHPALQFNDLATATRLFIYGNPGKILMKPASPAIGYYCALRAAT
jgi:hypothetical protein